MSILQTSKIQIRSGNLADLPQLAVGELGFTTDTRQLFVGNDSGAVGILPDNTEILTTLSDLPAPGLDSQVLFNKDGVLGATGSMIPAATGVFAYNYQLGNNATGLLTVNNANITDTLTAATLDVLGAAVINGNLTVKGNIIFVDQENLIVDDPVILIGANSAVPSRSDFATGVLMNYYSAGAARESFMGYLPAAGNPANSFVFLNSVTSISDTNVQGAFADIKVGNLVATGTISATITAPGANTQVVYNDSGTLGAFAGFTFNNTTNTVFSGNAFSASNLIASLSVSTPRIVNGTSNIRLVSGGNVTTSAAGVANVFTVTGVGANIVGILQTTGNITTTANANVGNVNSATGAFTANVTVANNISGANLVISNIANIGNVANIGNLIVRGNVLTTLLPSPGSDGTIGVDLGATGQRWRDLYLSGNTLYLGPNNSTSGFSVDSIGNVRATTGGGATFELSGVAAGTGLLTVPFISATNSVTTPALISTGTLTVTGNANVGNIGAANGVFTTNVTIAGTLGVTGLSTLANLTVTGNTVTTGNAQFGNITATGTVTAADLTVTANLAAGNISTTGQITAAGNVTGANIITGNISATGNITGVNLSLTGGANVTGNLNVSTGNVNVVANVIAGDVRSTGVVTAIGNIFGGNLHSVATVTASTFVSNVAIGTAPLTVTSTTMVTNLHSDFANLSNHIAVTAATTGTYFPSFVSASPTGNYAVSSNANLGFNAATGNLSATILHANGGLSTGGTLSVTGVSTLGAVGNVRITGGTSGQFLQTNGLGVLDWVTVGTSAISNGTSGVSVPVADGNVNTSVGGVANVLVVTTAGANISGALGVANITTGANTTAGTITGNFTLTTGSRLNATYADLAERYTADENYPPGTLVMIGGAAEVTLATYAGRHSLAGIVSSEPAYVLNSAIADSVIIALTGRVPCRVVGNIAKGAMLTVSNIDGVATSVGQPEYGTVVARALQSYNSDSVGIIEVKVDRG